MRYDVVLADGYGSSAGFRAALMRRGPRWAVGVRPKQKCYPGDMALAIPANPPVEHPAKYTKNSALSV
jgi:hypothetical protein